MELVPFQAGDRLRDRLLRHRVGRSGGRGRWRLAWARRRQAVRRRFATLNGAILLGEERSIGSIAVGKAAYLVVLAGNPAKSIDDVEKVETVFKDGVGYDPAKLKRSVEGLMWLR